MGCGDLVTVASLSRPEDFGDGFEERDGRQICVVCCRAAEQPVWFCSQSGGTFDTFGCMFLTCFEADLRFTSKSLKHREPRMDLRDRMRAAIPKQINQVKPAVSGDEAAARNWPRIQTQELHSSKPL